MHPVEKSFCVNDFLFRSSRFLAINSVCKLRCISCLSVVRLGTLTSDLKMARPATAYMRTKFKLSAAQCSRVRQASTGTGRAEHKNSPKAKRNNAFSEFLTVLLTTFFCIALKVIILCSEFQQTCTRTRQWRRNVQ